MPPACMHGNVLPEQVEHSSRLDIRRDAAQIIGFRRGESSAPVADLGNEITFRRWRECQVKRPLVPPDKFAAYMPDAAWAVAGMTSPWFCYVYSDRGALNGRMIVTRDVVRDRIKGGHNEP
jgi:hypothetical protein